MIRLLFVLIIIQSVSIASNTDSTTIGYLRENFYAAIEDEELTYELEEFILKKYSDNISNYEPLLLAYYGGLEALKAKHAFNPFSKLSYIYSSLDYLEEAVNKKPGNLEIRFMRFSILHNLPGILGYGEERESDKKEILNILKKKNYSTLNKKIQEGIIQFMIDSERLNEEELENLELLKEDLAGK